MRVAALLLCVACTQPPPSPPPPDVATGALGAWQAGPALPVPRANHCSTVIGDWVLVIGGNHMAGSGFVKTDTIHAAKLVDGVLGDWHLAGTLPSPASECTATSDGRTLYVLDGLYDNEADGRQVWSATLDDAGMLSPLTSVGTLPDTVISSEAAVRDGTVTLMDTRLPADGDATLALRAPMQGLAWTAEELGIDFRAQAEYAFSADHLYTLGGYHDPATGVLADVFVAPLAGGPAVATTPLPMPVGFGEAVVVDDWLFVVGGRAGVFGTPGTTHVLAAPLAADGAVGAWQQTELPLARTNHELALVGDSLVVTGGAVNGPGDATVLVAQVRWSQSQ